MELIDRQEALRKLKEDEAYDEDIPNRADGVRDAIITIYGLPTIEAEPVKHGKWLEKDVVEVEDTCIEEVQSCKCPVCGRYLTTPYLYYFDECNYCPNCGAKMDGESDAEY